MKTLIKLNNAFIDYMTIELSYMSNDIVNVLGKLHYKNLKYNKEMVITFNAYYKLNIDKISLIQIIFNKRHLNEFLKYGKEEELKKVINEHIDNSMHIEQMQVKKGDWLREKRDEEVNSF